MLFAADFTIPTRSSRTFAASTFFFGLDLFLRTGFLAAGPEPSLFFFIAPFSPMVSFRVTIGPKLNQQKAKEDGHKKQKARLKARPLQEI
jgi:hypothetical protein